MDVSRRVGVVSVQFQGYEPQEVAATLDAAYHVQARAGLHCAPRMHRALGTLDAGGTIRFSLGAFTSASEIAAAVQAATAIAAASLSI
jgi:selenocysteine lyase/cysteine desulfurase